jgi:hypothetical protein
MKKLLVVLFVLLIPISFIYADSWKVFEPNFSYYNGRIRMNITLPSGAISNAFSVADGKTLLVVPDALPLLIDAAGNKSDEYAGDFKALSYQFSPLTSVIEKNKGEFYFQNTHLLACYNPATKKWEGFNTSGKQNNSTIPTLPCQNIFGVTFDLDGHLILTGTNDDEPFVALLKDNQWEIIKIIDTDRASLAEDKSYPNIKQLNITENKRLFDGYIFTSPVINSDGSLWMLSGTKNGKKLIKLERGSISTVDENVIELKTNHKGGLIYSKKDGIYQLEGEKKAERIIKETPLSIYVDSCNDLWYSVSAPTLSSMLPIHHKEIVYLKKMNLNTQAEVVYKYENTPFHTDITGINGNVNGDKVFVGGGLYILEKTDLTPYQEKWEIQSAGYLPSEAFGQIAYMKVNKNGITPSAISDFGTFSDNRWASVYENGKWEHYKINVEKEANLPLGMKGTQPRNVCNSSKGLFIGTNNDGLMIYDKSQQKALNVEGYNKKEYGESAREIVEDKQGNIWIATDKGLLKYDGATFTKFDKKSSEMKSNKVNCLYVSPNGVLWVGTGGDGVFAYDGAQWTPYTKKQGVKNDNITSLCGVGETVYASGVNMFKISKTLFKIENGTVSSEELPFSIASNAIDADEEGNLWLFSYKAGNVLIKDKDGSSSKVFNDDNSPLPSVGNVSYAYCFNGEVCIRMNYESMWGYESKDKAARKPGEDPFSKSADETIAEQYQNRMNTFDGDVIYILKRK